MAKATIHCVRHAQGFHNLSLANHTIADPLLTPTGKTQCTTLSQTFPSPQTITHLISSPLRRTLYTTLLSFPSAISRGLRITALPELQETSNLPCDTGSSVQDLEAEFSQGEYAGTVDFTYVPEDWTSKVGKWSPAAHAIERRARSARLFIRAVAEQSLALNPDQDVNIVVVTHGGYLHYFTDDWDGAGKFVGTGWANTEVRSYEFVDFEGDREGAALRETRESRVSRMGAESELGREEQRTLRDAVEREWCESGYQGPREETAKL
ncbi:histidine phosphatase superfamily [Rhexocercosporidium sp. MPI-PUGE-AT-0058]|nr:histidine phosphatase superfamily [Rhexocercosporidium sp. MPI-PUGE-AT-0058]